MAVSHTSGEVYAATGIRCSSRGPTAEGGLENFSGSVVSAAKLKGPYFWNF